jgi:hypothetical protein
MTPFLSTSLSSSNMAMGETSLPVPAVVGMQANRFSGPAVCRCPDVPDRLSARQQCRDQFCQVHGSCATHANTASTWRWAEGRESIEVR